MAGEDKKDFSAMLHNSKDMPKMKIITDTGSVKKYGDGHMYFTPSTDYGTLIRRILLGRVTAVGGLRDCFARVSHTDFTEPVTAGISISIAAWAGVRRRDDPTPYWRTLKANGELNAKYPGGVNA